MHCGVDLQRFLSAPTHLRCYVPYRYNPLGKSSSTLQLEDYREKLSLSTPFSFRDKKHFKAVKIEIKYVENVLSVSLLISISQISVVLS